MRQLGTALSDAQRAPPSTAALLPQVRCLRPEDPPGAIRILLLRSGGSKPLLTATLKMPPSEPEDV